MKERPPNLTFHPLTPDRWKDFETLFGERGACGGCWCMWWRVTRAQWDKQKGPGNKRAMKRIVTAGQIPGILAYDGANPVAWCSVAPREEFPVLGRSRVLKPIDDAPVWSIVCLFIAKEYRRRGVSTRVLKGAVDYAKKNGAAIVEGYPHDLTGRKSPLPDPFVFTGLISAYNRAGFTEVARRSATRPIVRTPLRR